MTERLVKIQAYISEGAKAFLGAEYKILAWFIVIFGIFVLLLLGLPKNCGIPVPMIGNETCSTENPVDGCEWIVPEAARTGCWKNGIASAIAFVIGGSTSILCGYIGMSIAVYANARTATMCQVSWTDGFNTAFRAGSVMGFCLTSLGLLILYGSLWIFGIFIPWDTQNTHISEIFFECMTGYGLGGSSIALFGRVGGGIYTKAADVGADLVGKVEAGIPEDDPRNPAVIADNVGDNVGDVAGMGADLFGSFAESSCAALVVASVSKELNSNWGYLMFPLLVSAGGIVSSWITSFFATSIPFCQVKEERHVERNLSIQLYISTILSSITTLIMVIYFLPDRFCVKVVEVAKNGSWCDMYSSRWAAYACVMCGLWSGLLIGKVTDYMTSYNYGPVKEVSKSCETGAATNIIFGLALGYKSVVVPIFAMAITIFVSFYFANMYGVALAALGMLSTLSTGLTIDAYGPITDNAGGIAEMAGLSAAVRVKTDALDAAGNTTAAIGKGFAIGSAALVSLALFGAFVTRSHINGVDILKPQTFAGLIVGAMLPYWFSALTMKSVGKAASSMVEEVRQQFKEHPGIMNNTEEPDYKRCVAISTNASLIEMIAPGVLVMLTPIIVGLLFGVKTLTGVLAGGLVSGVQMAISASNTGGAWDNAKKYIEKGNFGGKGSAAHKAGVVGDTVGDPLKDTSGPSLNILMKLMAIISLVFAPTFTSYKHWIFDE
ncbi:MAG: V-type H(+)-translocating pyrophosphatase [Candidatus Onthovivens sp.]|nr:V-type H(+)-translocating pyrophosphatase [Candidatus Onthovivens sp.]